jgi:hypothetical protein
LAWTSAPSLVESLRRHLGSGRSARPGCS